MTCDLYILSYSKVCGEARAQFNTTGICNPEKHYMVDLEQRLAEVKILVDDGKYFTINRARQFGKTTILQALGEYLNSDYFVVSMDFQMQVSNAKFKSENLFSLAFARAFVNSFKAIRTAENRKMKQLLRNSWTVTNLMQKNMSW